MDRASCWGRGFSILALHTHEPWVPSWSSRLSSYRRPCMCPATGCHRAGAAVPNVWEVSAPPGFPIGGGSLPEGPRADTQISPGPHQESPGVIEEGTATAPLLGSRVLLFFEGLRGWGAVLCVVSYAPGTFISGPWVGPGDNSSVSWSHFDPCVSCLSSRF